VIKAVFDANVLVSGIAGVKFPRSTTGELIRRWRNHELIVVTSDHIVREVQHALTKPYFQDRISAADQRMFIELIEDRAELVEITDEVRDVATHSEDDVVLSTAVSAQVRHLVTGDTGLLSVGRYRGVSVLSPAAFLAQLLPFQ